MALLTCTDCFHQFSDTLSICPKCSRVITAKDRETSEQASKWVGWGCLVVALLFFGTCAYFTSKPQPAEQVAAEQLDRRLRDVYRHCQEKVTEQLRSPSTAQFPSFSGGEARVNQDTDSTYIVIAWVDASNAFGAPIRNNFACEIIYSGKTWRVGSLAIVPR